MSRQFPSLSLVRAQRNFTERLSELGLVVEMERQIGPYVVDIYVQDADFVIEIDGPFHNKKADQARDVELLKLGVLKVIHFNYQGLRISDKRLIEVFDSDKEVIYVTPRKAPGSKRRRR